MPDVRYEITFTGHVQGVNFRWTTCRVAAGFGVAGWVRNENDGSVRCVVEGEAGEVDRFASAVQRAMAGHIEGTRIERSDPTGEFAAFVIRRR